MTGRPDLMLGRREAVGGEVADPTKVRARPIHQRMDRRSAAANIVLVSMPRGVFESEIVAEVQITSGQRALGEGVQDLSDGGNLDLAVMDDYLDAEPREIR